MKPKRGETAEQTINRWADELLACQNNDFAHALECVGWLQRRLEARRAEHEKHRGMEEEFCPCSGDAPCHACGGSKRRFVRK
jgi:hypothetical protein